VASRSTFLALLLGTLVALSAAEGFAQTQGAPKSDAPSRGAADVPPDVAAKAASIARQTMSPFCPGRTLDDCPSEYATEWRRDIREMVAKGMTAAEIQDELEKRVGGNLSGIPNRESSYALPIIFATGAALVLYLVFVRLRRKDDEGGSEDEKEPGSKKKAKKPATLRAVDDERLKRELADED
jgi:cytochrome c-type biogenesis protein CcmH/NrfF